MEVYQCDRCGTQDKTVKEAWPFVSVSPKTGLTLHKFDFRHFVFDKEYGEPVIVFPLREEKDERLRHICANCINNAISKHLSSLQKVLSPFDLQTPLHGEYVSSGRMLTEQQRKALETLKPLLLGD